jgi:hypothetical protein
LGAGLVMAGCGATYNVASGLTGSSGAAGRSTLVYWNLLAQRQIVEGVAGTGLK